MAMIECRKCFADAVPCGPAHDDYVDGRWACGSYLSQPEGNVPQEFHQSDRCRIAELEKRLREVRAAVRTGEMHKYVRDRLLFLIDNVLTD